MRALTLLASLGLAIPAAAQQQLASKTVPASPRDAATMSSAIRATESPVVDGWDTDPVWKTAPLIDSFLEYEPNEGAEPRFKTQARVAYDDKAIYVLVRMFDPAPDSIVSLLSRRDVRTPSEQVKILIDSYNDRRTGYQFAVNPAGVKRDFYVYNDVVEDPSWDAVWDVGTSIDSLGWTAEFRIPFSQLRFANKREHTFGLMIVRDVARTNQRISWPLFRRNQQGYVSQSGRIEGLRDIPSPRRLELTPYVVMKSVTEPVGSDFTHKQEVTGGADIKYGLTSNLTLDATVNPDFGQVEADPAVLNLTAFETFFEERRPFFLEGTGIFTFNVNCGDIDTGCTGLFYSRRVGRAPQLGGVYGDARSPTSTTILGAGKITGRLANGMSIGLLDAVTQRETGPQDRTIEPRTNYAVARLQQDLRDGQSGIGVMVTAVNRDLDEWTEGWLRREAYSGGLDVRHRFFDKKYELAAYVAGSMIRGSEEAIAAVQQNGVHGFQRPDDDLDFDPTRTSLAGDAQRISISKFGGGITRFQTVYQRYSPGFEINDVGFLSRADEQMLRHWFALQFNKPALFYRRAFWNFNLWNHWTSDGLPLRIGTNSNAHVEFRNTWWGHLWLNYGGFMKTFDDRSARGGPAIRRSEDWSVGGGIELDRRKAITPNLFGGIYGSDEGKSHGWWIEPFITFRAASSFSASLGAYIEGEVDDNQWVTNFGVAGVDTTHYTFARLEQTTVNLTTRLNYTVTPTLSLQVYAQPFVSTGTFSNWRELNDPRADDYDERYRPYAGDPGGFNVKQFRSNTVVRWEYRPGSTLFLVWTQGRQDFDPTASRFDASRDYDDLFGLHPDNTFLIKASYWFNP